MVKTSYVGRVQSFYNRADHDNLDAYTLRNLHAGEEVKSNTELRGKSLIKTIRFSTSLPRQRELGQNTLAFSLLGVYSRKNLNHEYPLKLVY